MRLVVLASTFCVVVLAGPASAQAKFSAIHGASTKVYQDWIAGLDAKKMRAVYVSALEVKGEPTFAAIAIENADKKPWLAKHNLSVDRYQQEFTAQKDKGGRPIAITGYKRGDATSYAAVWVKDDFKDWQARHNLTGKQQHESFNMLTKEGYRPIHIVGYPVGNETHFASIYVKGGFKNWVSRYGLTAEKYQDLFEEFAKKNARPLSVSAYATKDGTRFAAILVENVDKIEWGSKHHLTPKQYQEYFNEMTGKGYAPTQIVAYPWEGETRYVAVFVKDEK
jgi:hypothetical protein